VFARPFVKFVIRARWLGAPENGGLSVCRLYSTGHTRLGRFDMTGQTAIDPRANRLLRALSDAELQRMRPALEPVHLPRPTELEAANEEIRFVYFPTTGIASIVAIDESGESVDTAMIGREGMTGLAVFLGTGQSPVRTIVQIPMAGLRMESGALREELARGGRLVTLLGRHTQVVMITMAQLILCNRIHRLDQRAARWLLQVDDRVDEAPFKVTQEFLAQMIGVQRPALSVAMRQFKEAGLVRYVRGQITIDDPDGLLARSCGCSKVIASEGRRLERLERADRGAR
jgi:CRP-like cAMP-binding protein